MKEAHLNLVTRVEARTDDTLMGLAQGDDEGAFAEIVRAPRACGPALVRADDFRS